MTRAFLALMLAAPVSAQISDAIEWRYGYAEHLRTRGDRVVDWPAAPCGHSGHLQRGLGPRPTDQQLEALRIEYLASPEYAAKVAAIQEEERDREDIPGHDESVRTMESLIELLIEERVIPRAKAPARVLERINRRRARKGRPGL